MSSKRTASLPETKKMTVRFFVDDLDFLRTHFPGVGYNRVIRSIIHREVLRMRERRSQDINELKRELKEPK